MGSSVSNVRLLVAKRRSVSSRLSHCVKLSFSLQRVNHAGRTNPISGLHKEVRRLRVLWLNVPLHFRQLQGPEGWTVEGASEGSAPTRQIFCVQQQLWQLGALRRVLASKSTNIDCFRYLREWRADESDLSCVQAGAAAGGAEVRSSPVPQGAASTEGQSAEGTGERRPLPTPSRLFDAQRQAGDSVLNLHYRFVVWVIH